MRFCTNCRAELPPKAEECPACGVYAGDVFDGRPPRAPRGAPGSRIGALFFALAVAAILAGAAWWVARDRRIGGIQTQTQTQPPAPEVRVVGDRPGGARRAVGAVITEAEAIRLLRRHLVTTRGISADCLALMSHGPSGNGYVITAVHRCESVRLGKWRVDGKTREVTPAK